MYVCVYVCMCVCMYVCISSSPTDPMKVCCLFICLQDLALKDLILEAHYKGQQVPQLCCYSNMGDCCLLLQELLYVIPFVAKVLEACSESQVFKAPNPWTMAIMAVLSELHAVPDLKVWNFHSGI